MHESRYATPLGLRERRVANLRLLGNRLRFRPALHDLPLVARLAGSSERACEAFDESLVVCQSHGQAADVTYTTASLGHLYEQQGVRTEAADLFLQSLRMLSGQATELGIATAVCGVGRMALDALLSR
jgi:hypothetical protein